MLAPEPAYNDVADAATSGYLTVGDEPTYLEPTSTMRSGVQPLYAEAGQGSPGRGNRPAENAYESPVRGGSGKQPMCVMRRAPALVLP